MFAGIKAKLEEAKVHYGIGVSNVLNSFSSSLNGLFIDREFFDADFFEDLEERLIELDILPRLALVITSEIEKKIYNQRVNKDKFNETLYDVINNVTNIRQNNDLELSPEELNVLLIIGINGVGKTTTISKLTNMYKNEGFDIKLIAGDTFRAGAIDQLAIWAERLNVDIMKTHQGHAPSAVVYKGMEAAVHDKNNLVICDTAGRLHNKDELMNELKKLHTIIVKHDEQAKTKTILILDGTAGKNTIEQARAFNEIAQLDGVIVTKMDSNAKAGMIINISFELNVPIYFLTTGEQVADIKKFDSEQYLMMMLGQTNE